MSEPKPLAPRATISSHPPDPAFAHGARNAVNECLDVQRGERVAIITHPGEPASIASSLLAAAVDAGAAVDAFVLRASEAADPSVLGSLVSRLPQYDVSFLVSSIDGLPIELRRRVVDVGQTRRRHGHLIGISGPMMAQSMRADYREVDRVSTWLASRLGPGARIHATTPAGTDLRIRVDHVARLGVASGVLVAPGWTNLPGGEVFALPATVDGVLVPDGGIWEPDGTRLAAVRTRLTFERGEVAAIDGPPDVRGRLERLFEATAGARRVGQVGFGTNTGVVTPIGALLQDLKLPGFHVTLGHTCPEITGAKWDADVEIPLLTRRASVTIDEEPVLVAGRYPRAASL